MLTEVFAYFKDEVWKGVILWNSHLGYFVLCRLAVVNCAAIYHGYNLVNTWGNPNLHFLKGLAGG